ncbi:hypothetical protein BpHYR1_029908 [Brachionus plicatilis]|uniref:Uncharacterized protein n=1 Tax=Brachionus plicatilis TaxID=10195 RepID=A0A3M7SVW1_BRAPC|nr:hypothetical protein BpHYR1_029908 [Brachionus plicatilis]
MTDINKIIQNEQFLLYFDLLILILNFNLPKSTLQIGTVMFLCWPPEKQRGLRRKIARITEPEKGAENFNEKGSRDGEKKQLPKR